MWGSNHTVRTAGRGLVVLGLFVLGLLAGGFGPLRAAESLLWHSDYTQAQTAARDSGKFLCLVFEDPAVKSTGETSWSEISGRPEFIEATGRHVLARVPRDASIQMDGRPVRLIEHAAFREMKGRAGVAIVDYTSPDSPHFGHVVSVYPRYPVPQPHLLEMFRLPSGSLTQRTLVLAVRMHPERPRSTQGRFDGLLAGEAESHSRYQARITNQGHHNFDSRFHRINGRLTGGLMVQEVVAESWPGQDLFEAAVECVASWRTSSGHWSAVRSAHPLFGYDMKRGSNGVWYATGLFARP